MDTKTIGNLVFEPFLEAKTIALAVKEMGEALEELNLENPIFLVVLNGASVFASDLIRSYARPMELEFIRLKSYSGTESLGQVSTIVGLDSNIEGRDVVVVEDIVDTGTTWGYLKDYLTEFKPQSISLATFLHKPEKQVCGDSPELSCFQIKDEFVVGYGLDYDGLGRNWKDLYTLKNK